MGRQKNLPFTRRHLFLQNLLLGSALLSSTAFSFAADTPNSGNVVRELNNKTPEPPIHSSPLLINRVPSSDVPAGGPSVLLKQLSLVGNEVYQTDEIINALGPVIGQTYDLAGLYKLANQISDYYREHGYPFVRTFLPPQQTQEGVITIEVIEGRYGTIKTVGDPTLAPQAQPWLGRLKRGEVISEQALERATLLMSDLPGISTKPYISPGELVGSGDLSVDVQSQDPYTFDVNLDNHGSRYTGYHRVQAIAQWNGARVLGDQTTIKSLVSDDRLWLGTVSYSLPLGFDGARGQGSFSKTGYVVGKDLSATDRQGDAQTIALGLSYPTYRSNRENYSWALDLRYNELNDQVKGVNSSKTTITLPLSLRFDVRESHFGPAIDYGSVTFTLGKLNLADASKDFAGTNGYYEKLNVDMARQQSLNIPNLSFYARGNAQIVNKNVDSSEGFSLGGPTGVRAYPTGEAGGAQGWLLQTEWRYALGNYTPYVLFDAGRVWVNARAYQNQELIQKTRSGWGLGIRFQDKALSFDCSIAWQQNNTPAESDPSNPRPAIFATMGYRF